MFKIIITELANVGCLDHKRLLNRIDKVKLCIKASNKGKTYLLALGIPSGEINITGLLDLIICGALTNINFKFEWPFTLYNDILALGHDNNADIKVQDNTVRIICAANMRPAMTKMTNREIIQQIDKQLAGKAFMPIATIGKVSTTRACQMFVRSQVSTAKTTHNPTPIVAPFNAVKKTDLKKYYDIDGLSLTCNVGSLSESLTHSLDLTLKTINNVKPLSKDSKFVQKGGICGIRERLSMRIGTYDTVLGNVNLFLISTHYHSDADVFYNLTHYMYSLVTQILHTSTKQPIINALKTTMKVNEEIKSISGSFPIQGLRLLENKIEECEELKAFKLIWYMEKFGCKVQGTAESPTTLLKYLHGDYTVEGLKYLSIDLSVNIVNIENGCIAPGFITFGLASSKTKKNEHYKAFGSPCWVNLAYKPAKRAGASIVFTQCGIMKIKFYSSITTQLASRRYLKTCIPKNMLRGLSESLNPRIENNQSNSQHRNQHENRHTIFRNILALEPYNYPFRLEGTVKALGMLDFVEYCNNFLDNAELFYVDVKDFKERASQFIGNLINLENTKNMGLVAIYKINIIETFIKEFCLRGATRAPFLTPKILRSLENMPDALVNGNSNIEKLRAVLEKEVSVLEAVRATVTVIKFINDISGNEKNNLIRLLSLLTYQPAIIKAYIVEEFFENITKVIGCPIKNILEANMVRNAEMEVCGLKEYINEILGLSKCDKKWTYFLQYRLAASNCLINKKDMADSFIERFARENIRFAPSIGYIQDQFAGRRFVRLLYKSEDADARKMAHDKLTNIIREKFVLPKRVDWTKEEVQRFLHGLAFYGVGSRSYGRILSDFSYGFYYTRKTTNVTDMIKNQIRKKNKSLEDAIEEARANYMIESFTIAEHLAYLQKFNINLDEEGKALYETVLSIDATSRDPYNMYESKHGEWAKENVGETNNVEEQLVKDIKNATDGNAGRIMTLEAEPAMESLEISQYRHVKKVRIEPLTLSASDLRALRVLTPSLFTRIQKRWYCRILNRVGCGIFLIEGLKNVFFKKSKTPNDIIWNEFIDKGVVLGCFENLLGGRIKIEEIIML